MFCCVDFRQISSLICEERKNLKITVDVRKAILFVSFYDPLSGKQKTTLGIPGKCDLYILAYQTSRFAFLPDRKILIVVVFNILNSRKFRFWMIQHKNKTVMKNSEIDRTFSPSGKKKEPVRHLTVKKYHE